MAKGSYVLKDRHIKILSEIAEKTGLKKSVIVRQSIELFYEKWWLARTFPVCAECGNEKKGEK